MVEIRKLSAADAEQFRELCVRARELNPEAFAETPEEFSAMSDDEVTRRVGLADTFPQSFVLGAFDGVTLVGMVGFRREGRQKLSHKGYIWGTFVSPEFRGQAIGRRLLEQLISECRTFENLQQLHLWVPTINSAADELYKSCGFETCGVEKRSLNLGERYIDLRHAILTL